MQVAAKADAVWVHIPWRRRDATPDKKEIIVIDAATNRRVQNVLRVHVDREFGDLLFQPPTAPGEYYVYYLPYRYIGCIWWPTTVYTLPTDTAQAAWAKACQPLAKRMTAGDTQGIPAAKVLEFQLINDFHRFDPMEVPATAAEMRKLLAAHAGKPYLLFPEDRRFPIRMTDELPLRWIRSGPSDSFRGAACRGEYYVFQVGVYAIGAESRQRPRSVQPAALGRTCHSRRSHAVFQHRRHGLPGPPVCEVAGRGQGLRAAALDRPASAQGRRAGRLSRFRSRSRPTALPSRRFKYRLPSMTRCWRTPATANSGATAASAG